MAEGFAVDVAVSLPFESVVSWFESYWYCIVATSTSIAHPDASLLAPSVSEQRRSIYKAQGCATVVLAGGDMDPVYLIEM